VDYNYPYEENIDTQARQAISGLWLFSPETGESTQVLPNVYFLDIEEKKLRAYAEQFRVFEKAAWLPNGNTLQLDVSGWEVFAARSPSPLWKIKKIFLLDQTGSNLEEENLHLIDPNYRLLGWAQDRKSFFAMIDYTSTLVQVEYPAMIEHQLNDIYGIVVINESTNGLVFVIGDCGLNQTCTIQFNQGQYRQGKFSHKPVKSRLQLCRIDSGQENDIQLDSSGQVAAILCSPEQSEKDQSPAGYNKAQVISTDGTTGFEILIPKQLYGPAGYESTDYIEMMWRPVDAIHQ
jgi:hypothetical protein